MPRIVEEAENRRLNGGGVGNLDAVLKDRHCGMYSRRLLASRHLDTLSAATKGLDGDPTAIAGDVISRRGSRYVLKPEGEKDWEQTLTLHNAELRKLVAILDEQLEVAGPAHLKGKQLEAMVFNEARERAEFTRSMLQTATFANMSQPAAPAGDSEQPPVVRRLTLKYLSEDQAKDDMTLVRLHDDYYVRSVQKNGHAYRKGVRVGHMLLELRRATPKSNKKMAKVPPRTALPEVLVIRDHMRDEWQAYSWPCSLTFDVLPKGWRAVELVSWEGSPTEELPPGLPGRDDLPAELSGDQYLQWLVHARCDSAEIVFKREPHAVVCRDGEHAVRHEHRWERYVKFDREDDILMLRRWGIDAHMSPIKMNYVFKRLIKVLQKELNGFASHRYDFITALLRKVRMMVALENTAHANSRRAHLSIQAANVHKELMDICSECPVFVLEAIKDECTPMAGAVPDDIYGYSMAGGTEPVTRRHNRRSAHDGSSPTSPGTGSQSVSPRPRLRFGGLRKQMPQQFMGVDAQQSSHEEEDYENPVVDGSLLSSVQDVNATLSRSESTQSAQVRCEAPPGEIINRLLDVLDDFFARTRGSSSSSSEDDWTKPLNVKRSSTTRRILRRSTKNAKNRGKAPPEEVSLYAERSVSKNMDGRLSFDEFQAAFIACGMSQLTSREMRDLFEALDVNHDGYLIIPEVLRIAYRLADLAELLVKHEQRELAAGRKFHSKHELLDDFMQYHLYGEDLVGTTIRNTIPDTQIVVSSDHHTLPGEQRYAQRGRLNSKKAWMAHDSDMEPFIEWRLHELSKIQAVETLGHPGNHDHRWVTRYRLQYSLAEHDSPLVLWTDYPHELSGNEDSTNIRVQPLEPFHATRVRLCPLDWYPTESSTGLRKGPALRASLRGFPIPRESYVHHHINT